MSKALQTTAWTEFFTPDASTDRGWFKALTEPYDFERYLEYSHATMPIWDDDIKAWREQSTLGNYLDYRPCRSWARPDEPQIHCVCYAAHTSKYVMTVAEAREWVETESLRVRPELVIQQRLDATPSLTPLGER